jgi:hypothetical protein
LIAEAERGTSLVKGLNQVSQFRFEEDHTKMGPVSECDEDDEDESLVKNLIN